MLHLPFPLVNVLTKIDNISKNEPLPFNLDFYTEVQDLDYILPHLEAEQNNTSVAALLSQASTDGEEQADPMADLPATKFTALNQALIQLIGDFGLIGFETLAVENKESMLNLIHAIDRASGYVFGTEKGTNESIWQVAMQEGWGGKMDIRDVQERWIDRKEEFDELERKGWEEEAKMAGAKPAAEVRRTAPESGPDQDTEGVKHEQQGAAPDLEDDEDLEAMQAAYLRDKEQNKDAGIKVIKKG